MKRILIIVLMLFVLVGCITKEYSFKVLNENIIFEQSETQFHVSMLKDKVQVFLGEKETNFDAVSYSGDIDLLKVGQYEISLNATNKNKVSKLPLVINVVDTVKPEFLLFENEFLIYKNELIQMISDYFFINLVDGPNGIINERMSFEGSVNKELAGLYPVTLIGQDLSGNKVEHDVNVRVTDIIDEKAMYLYQRAIKAAHGETLVFKKNDPSLQIINFDTAFNVFTPNYRSHFMWLSGINGTFNPKQSGVQLFKDHDNMMYASIKPSMDADKYVGTSLSIQNEDEGYRHYIATSTYKNNEETFTRIYKFIIRELDGIWHVEEFYMPY